MTPFWDTGLLVECWGEEGRPEGLIWEGRRQSVVRTYGPWRVHTDWWRGDDVWREYWEAATEAGFLLTLFRDLHSGAWYVERVWE